MLLYHYNGRQQTTTEGNIMNKVQRVRIAQLAERMVHEAEALGVCARTMSGECIEAAEDDMRVTMRQIAEVMNETTE